MSADTVIFDRALMRRRRARVAGDVGAHDFLLRRVAEETTARLAAVRRQFSLALDLGAHHGLLGRAVSALPSVGTVIGAESTPGPIGRYAGPRLVCDEELLPFARRSFDLIVSGLSLHMVNDLPGALVQARDALKPDGLFLAAMLGGRTLTELRQAFVQAEAETVGGASPRIAPFADVRDGGALLQRAGFALPVADADAVRVTYETPFALMQELRGMGASNVLVERSRRPLRRATLMRAAEIYRERFAAEAGRVAATFEIVYLTGWAPHESQQKALKPGSAQARLADALGVPEQSGGVAAPGGDPHAAHRRR